MTNKLDHNSATVARYTYYANGPLATRYTPAKGTTYYYYDALGSLTNVNYPATTDVTLQNDARNRLTNQVDGAGTTRYTYDRDGQLESARGYTSGGTPLDAEQLGYQYDTGWNLNQRTNNGAVTSFGVDNVNQLTSGPDGSYVYDSNGNMTQSGSYHTYEYDDENRLVRLTYTATFRTEFVYDT